MKTTLNEILKHDPCGQHTRGKSGFSKLLKFLNKTESDDEPLSFVMILESNGIRDAIWCLRVFPDYDLKVMEFKLKCARRVEHLCKSKECLDVVEAFIAGNVIKDDLISAYAAASAAAHAAHAADAAASAASAAAADAAAAHAAYAAASAEREYQTQIFKEIFG